jgi:tetratricopeptide (TPR) repeat protein
MSCRTGVSVLVLVFAALSPCPFRSGTAAGGEEPRAVQILKEAEANEKNRTVLEKCLAQIDREIAARPNLALNHYTRGWLLSRLARPDDAVAAYDRALALDPKLADAAYNAGVVLADMRREEEALKRWDAAVKADPKHVDALYNAGQLRYNRKEFAKALECWSKARLLAPADFGVAKKVLQATNALGDRAAAKKAREAVFEIWRTSQDDQVRKLTEYVFDQFDVGKLHVYAFETFEPKGDLYCVYTFRAAGPDNKIVGTVQLESSKIIREMGTPYILGYTTGAVHHTTSSTFKELPTYEALKPQIVRLVEEHLTRKAEPEPAPATNPEPGTQPK